MRWAKEHFIGLALGIVAYELYWRKQKGSG